MQIWLDEDLGDVIGIEVDMMLDVLGAFSGLRAGWIEL